jgi:ABC-type transport system involved in multi-copper enzyme maturation permease subunit
MTAGPSTLTTIATITRVTLLRLVRGKLLWVGLVIAALPVLVAMLIRAKADALATTFGIVRLLLVVLPPLYVASSIGEDIEDRTATYLWSRPLARWTVIAGKLVALAPVVAALVVLSWMAACTFGLGRTASTASIGALVAGTIVVACACAGIATLFPKHGMAFSIVYVLVDLTIGELPASLRTLSITHHVKLLSGLWPAQTDTSSSSSLIALAVIPAVWLALGARRIGRVET